MSIRDATRRAAMIHVRNRPPLPDLPRLSWRRIHKFNQHWHFAVNNNKEG
jgi:hypothetical protein